MPDTRPGEHAPEDLIDVLVAQALDDLENHRFDVATALRTVACLAWVAAARGRARAPGSDAFEHHERGEG